MNNLDKGQEDETTKDQRPEPSSFRPEDLNNVANAHGDSI